MILYNINDISKLGGGEFPPHVTHRTGESVDIKFMTTDGKLHPEYPNYYDNPYYDREKTEKFIIFAIRSVPQGYELRQVNFNDLYIVNKYKNVYFNSQGKNVIRRTPGHDDHIDFQYRRR